MTETNASARWHFTRASEMVCSECFEPVVSHVEITNPGGLGDVRHEVWTHEDGEPLCPIVGPAGYTSCDPMPASEVPYED